MKKLILKSTQSPGDICTLTAAIESLHRTYPGEYITDFIGTAKEIFENNPWITDLSKDPEAEIIECHYPSIHNSDNVSSFFLEGYTKFLSNVLQKPLSLCTNRPHLYLSKEEKEWMNQVQEHKTNGNRVPYWIINTGIKRDFTCKQWPVEYYQEVVNQTSGFIQWVQIGSNEHEHHPLKGVINFIGQTDTRQLIRLVYNCDGGLGPVTFLQHLCAAFEKTYLCLLGGREPVSWITYPKQTIFHTIGQLECCKDRACWISRVVPLKDKDEKNNNTCKFPILGYIKPVAKCMAMIKPEEVIMVLRRCLL